MKGYFNTPTSMEMSKHRSVRSSVKSAEGYRNSLMTKAAQRWVVYLICRKSIKYLWLECKEKPLARLVIADESSIVRVYNWTKSKGLVAQLVLLLWVSKILPYENPYSVTGTIKVTGL